jgi:hypothetical protein
MKKEPPLQLENSKTGDQKSENNIHFHLAQSYSPHSNLLSIDSRIFLMVREHIRNAGQDRVVQCGASHCFALLRMKAVNPVNRWNSSTEWNGWRLSSRGHLSGSRHHTFIPTRRTQRSKHVALPKNHTRVLSPSTVPHRLTVSFGPPPGYPRQRAGAGGLPRTNTGRGVNLCLFRSGLNLSDFIPCGGRHGGPEYR